jgi:hypothetical protein
VHEIDRLHVPRVERAREEVVPAAQRALAGSNGSREGRTWRRAGGGGGRRRGEGRGAARVAPGAGGLERFLKGRKGRVVRFARGCRRGGGSGSFYCVRATTGVQQKVGGGRSYPGCCCCRGAAGAAHGRPELVHPIQPRHPFSLPVCLASRLVSLPLSLSLSSPVVHPVSMPVLCG